MSLNPMTLMQLKTSWDRFIHAHPKFPKFWKAAYKNGLTQGTVIEFTVKTPDGRELASNIKLTQDDLELAAQLQELLL